MDKTPNKKPNKKSNKDGLENNVTFSSVTEKWENLISFSKNGNCDWLDAWGKAFATNPYVQNQRLKELKTLASRFTREQIESMLRDPLFNEQKLRGASHYFYNTIAPIMKIYNMYADILSYRTYIVANKKNTDNKKFIEEYEYLVNKKRQFDPKRTFRNITLQTFKEGKKFYYLRMDEGNDIFTLQEMPNDYCKIVHRWEGGWQYSFNMMYFLKPGVSPEWFAPEFKDYLAEFFCYYDKDKKQMSGIAELPNTVDAYYENRSWYFWKEMPIDKGWVFGLDDSTADVVPPLSSMFLDANELNSYKLLEQELLSIPLKQIMTATVPFSSDNKTGSHANDTAITPDLITLYQDIIQTILPQSVDFIAAPFENFSIHTLESVASKNSIVGDAVKNFYNQGGVSGLLSTSDKPNIAMVKTTQVLETAFVDKLYHQYVNFLNTIKKNMNLKNDFSYCVEGDRFSDKDVLASIEKALSSGNSNLYSQFLSFFGQDLDTASSTMDLVDAYGIFDKLKPMMSANQMSGKQTKTGNVDNGRPPKNPEDMTSDGSVGSAESGSNTNEGRSTESQ